MHRRILERIFLDMIHEDEALWDKTTEHIPQTRVRAEIISKEDTHVSGIHESKILFELFNINVVDSADDGQTLNSGERLFVIEGNSRDILLVERTALNILSRMCGISTTTMKAIDKAKEAGDEVIIAATRKTTPLFSYFEKKAVMVAGGDTHRLNLSDSILIKENHRKLFGDVRESIKKIKESKSFVDKIEIEVGNEEDAFAAAESGADIVMFDNMAPAEIREVISGLKEKGLRKNILLEASGGINLDNIAEYAKTGVDAISCGMLTHSTHTVDLTLRIIQ
ncbi:MAG: carboxylating nicotinate-nucleotide diphosphorylase [Candidatus Altiarchaeales archaeon]|nr:carboxylating nicotinate-nucleotide diphosphorylase [Candidatus Altiarchaeales archaeon]